MKRQMRWLTGPRLAVAAVLLCLTAGGAAVLDPGSRASRDDSGWSVASLLNLRSPGERGSGALLASKQRLSQASLEEPDEVQQRALGKIFPAEAGLPLSSAEIAASPILTGPPLAGTFPELAGLTTAEFGGGTPSLEMTLASAPGFGLRGGGFPGTSGLVVGSPPPIHGLPGGPVLLDPPGNPPAVVPSIIAAVPEPQTWLMMMLGMFACGAALRRRRRNDVVVELA